MSVDAEMIIDSVSIVEKSLFRGTKSWIFYSLNEAIEALEAGNAICRRTLSKLDCTVEKRFVVSAGGPQFERNSVIQANGNQELIFDLQMLECERLYFRMQTLMNRGLRELDGEAETLLEDAILTGECGYALNTLLQVSGFSGFDFELSLAACYGELLERLNSSKEADTSPQSPNEPLPPLGHPDRNRARIQRFLQRENRDSCETIGNKIGRYQNRYEELKNKVWNR